MTKKHIAIEILPRALWIIQGIILAIVSKRPMTTSNNWLLLVGIPITIFGIYYLVSTFYKIAKPMVTKELVTDGQYKKIRHPMYVAMYILLIGIGILFFSNSWFITLMVFIPVWYIDCKIEESQMIDLCGEKYLEYKKQTKMFIPNIF